MFIRSGEWDIISRHNIYRIIRKINKFIRSLWFRIFVVIVILGILPVIILEFVIHAYYKGELVDDNIAGLQRHAITISEEIVQYPDVSAASVSLFENFVRRYAFVLNMRISLVDQNYMLLLDTYDTDETKKMIFVDATDQMTEAVELKHSVSQYNEREETIQLVAPIYDAQGNIMCIMIMDSSAAKTSVIVSNMEQKIYVIRVTMITLLMVFAGVAASFITMELHKTFDTVDQIAMGYYEKRLDDGGYSDIEGFAASFNDIMDKMHKLNESRQEFVSNVSHELKTPITSMKVLAESLNSQENVPVELYKEFMQDIVEEIDRESKIIDDLLSLVKLDKSAVPLNIASVNINEVLELILKRLKPLAQKKNIELLFESFRPVVAEIDEVKFTLAISNLVENAIKYNQVDGWVHVSLNADHQHFYIRVEDNGIGIPEESQNMIFERFYRVDKARSRETGGTGLGLAIVRNSILMHKGAIKLHSEENAGTTFTIRIPLNYMEE